MTCVVQPTIKILVRQSDGTQVATQIPVLRDVPIVFPCAGGFAITLPIQQGDEVLVIFASRCIDGWWQNGGVQNQAEFRLHDLSDGFAIPGPQSLPNVLPSISADTAQLRTRDGSAYIELTADGVVNIVAPGGVNITGDVSVTGKIDATDEITGNGIELSQHVHGGVQRNGGNTDAPTG